MSLPLSSNRSAPEALCALLPEVVSDVAEQMFFGWAEACDAEQASALVRGGLQDTGQDWLYVDVGFGGGIDGQLHLALPCDLARELAAAMLGTPDGSDVSGPLLDDVAGELANMICGAVLTRGERTQQFELLRPLVSRGDSTAAAAILSPGVAFFSVNERPLIVRLALVGSADAA